MFEYGALSYEIKIHCKKGKNKYMISYKIIVWFNGSKVSE